jgi:formate hydrogenlyase transcriptional activator
VVAALVVDGLLARGHLDTEHVRSYAPENAPSHLVRIGLEAARRSQGSVSLEEPVTDDLICEGMVGRSVALRNVVTQLQTVAPTDSTVLICGETGTGKELIARALHTLSTRRGNPFVKCNCAAIPTGLLESELFGHEKGAFTGAVAQRIGRFELANRGTIFLDEIGETPLELQPKLLRVLQEREFERLGNSRTLRTDARLIAATNVNLQEMVDAKRFRADLFYRLHVFPIQIPPLRERPEDIRLLVTHFAHECARRMHRTIKFMPSATMDALVRYSWPGNIRELQNLIERAVILSSGEELQVPVSEIDSASKTSASQQTLEEAERAHILETLKKTRWTLSGPRGAATRLGLKRSTLQFRMKKLGIERPPENDEATH